jgi:hypothetical protein
MHELDRLAPALVLELDDRVLAALVEAPADLGSDPLLGAVGDPPPHAAGRIELENLHVEATEVAEPESPLPADLALAYRVSRPPAGDALWSCHCPVDVVERSDDADPGAGCRPVHSPWLVLRLSSIASAIA